MNVLPLTINYQFTFWSTLHPISLIHIYAFRTNCSWVIPASPGSSTYQPPKFLSHRTDHTEWVRGLNQSKALSTVPGAWPVLINRSLYGIFTVKYVCVINSLSVMSLQITTWLTHILLNGRTSSSFTNLHLLLLDILLSCLPTRPLWNSLLMCIGHRDYSMSVLSPSLVLIF